MCIYLKVQLLCNIFSANSMNHSNTCVNSLRVNRD